MNIRKAMQASNAKRGDKVTFLYLDEEYRLQKADGILTDDAITLDGVRYGDWVVKAIAPLGFSFIDVATFRSGAPSGGAYLAVYLRAEVPNDRIVDAIEAALKQFDKTKEAGK